MGRIPKKCNFPGLSSGFSRQIFIFHHCGQIRPDFGIFAQKHIFFIKMGFLRHDAVKKVKIYHFPFEALNLALK